MIHTVAGIQGLLQLPAFDLISVKVKDQASEGDIFIAVGAMEDVRREQDQLLRMHNISVILQHVVAFSILQKIKLIIIVIVGFYHIVVDSADSFTGNGSALCHPDSCLVNHNIFSSSHFVRVSFQYHNM